MMMDAVMTPERIAEQAQPTSQANGATPALPELEQGDRLTRAEFERRYQAMPHIKKAELIEGAVYMSSPVRRTHSVTHAHMIGWLAIYSAATPGTELGDNATVRLDLDNEPQPDVFLRIDAPQGQSQTAPDDYVEGAPELVVEIAGSSAAYDLYPKLNVYRRNGVQEYLVWQLYENKLDWFRLHEGQYARVSADAEGIIRSQVFPGLWLDVAALLKGDLVQVLKIVQQGVQSEAHSQFVQRLQQPPER